MGLRGLVHKTHGLAKVAPRRVELRSIAYKAIAVDQCATGPKESYIDFV